MSSVGSTSGQALPYALRALAPVVVVVGDLMLDGWWIGRTERMSREAPAPVVEVTERRHAPGGAANTAMNLAALGARVRLVGAVGDDEAGRLLRQLLVDGGVDVASVVVDASVRTVTKNRIVSGDQMLVRIDDVEQATFAADLPSRLVGAVVEAADGADAVCVCDYGSGLSLPAVRDALSTMRRPRLLVVDAHDLAPWAAVRPDLVTPNAAEAYRLLGRSPASTSRLADLLAAADALRHRSGAGTVVVTVDREGTVLIGPDGERHRTVADPTSERQAAGAGDTFVAALTMARLAGAEWPTAADLAQCAADIVVHRFGTSVCGTDDLVAHLGRLAGAPWDADALTRRVAADRAEGRRIVLTNGCFDVLHRGHTTYLAQAAQLGDVLIVALNSDDSVRRLKGPERPINAAADRAEVIAALSCVTYVTVFETDTPIPLLEQLRPDVYVKGGDYTPEMLPEADVVRSYGGEVRIVDYVPDHSTTDLVGRIRTGSWLVPASTAEPGESEVDSETKSA